METVQDHIAEAPPPGLSPQDERWALVRRIVRSPDFARSEQLSRLLLYVCRMHLAGRDHEVNEQRIGVDVFRRKPSFDSGSDSIVRSHATRLRQRLEAYFATTGQHERLRLDIPRGGYVPHYYTVEAPAETADGLPEPVGPALVDGPPDRPEIPRETACARSVPRLWWLVAALILVATAVAAFYSGRALSAGKAATPPRDEVVRRFWGNLFKSNTPTLVVTGDSALVLYETYARQDVSLSDYIAGNYQTAKPPSASRPSEFPRDLATRRYTSVADLNLAVHLTHLPEWTEHRADVIFARDLRASQAAQSNLVLIGSRQANPWVSLIDTSMNFVLTTDGDGRYFYLNRHPLAGEQQIYRPSQNGSGTTDSAVYALIAFRPSGTDAGNVLLLSGLWQSGTEAAGDYVLNDKHFADFLSKIARHDGSFPAFELLVQVRSVAGNAFSSRIVASRVQ